MTKETEIETKVSINEDLIRQYATGATPDGIRNLITLFTHQQDRMQRAEALCRAAWDHAIKLEKKIKTTEYKTSTAEPKAPKTPISVPKTPIPTLDLKF